MGSSVALAVTQVNILTSSTRLDDLPAEVLFGIFELLYEDKRHFRTKHFRTLYALSRVNRRLRGIALHLLWRDLSFVDYQQFKAFLRYELTDGERNPFKASVKNLHIGRAFHPWLSLPDKALIPKHTLYIESFVRLPFVNLTTFECTRTVCTESVVNSLSRCTRLSRLEMAWEGDAGFPSLRQLSSLRTLRLVLRRLPRHRAIRVSKTPSPPVVQNITTLAIYSKMSRYPTVSETTKNVLELQFPSLQYLTLDSVDESVKQVFLFIHCHPTILEANVTLDDYSQFRLEALFTLIDGTGTWSQEDLNGQEGLNGQYPRFHQLTQDEYEPDHPFPPDIANGSLWINKFAFARVPSTPDATQWKQPFGSRESRYRCTALSVSMIHEDPDGDDPDDFVPNFRNDVLRGLKTSGISASLVELRIFADLSLDQYLHGLHGTVIPWLSNLAKALKDDRWSSLRRLAVLWCSDPFASHLKRWGSRKIYAAHGPAFSQPVPYLDHSCPPWDYTLEGIVEVQTLAGVRQERIIKDSDLDYLISTIREVLNMDEHSELDEEDPNLLIRAWEARNKNLVRWLVLQIATARPSLEEFDWWLKGSVDDQRYVLWKWTVRRDEHGQLKSLDGKLTWTGCFEGCMPIHVAVGSELEHASKTWKLAQANSNLI